MTASSAMPVRTACRMHSLFGTGSMPGIAASTRLTCVFGSAPNAVAAPENSLDAVAVICAWTSSPTTTSQSPVAPLTRKGTAASAIVGLGSDQREGRKVGPKTTRVTGQDAGAKRKRVRTDHKIRNERFPSTSAASIFALCLAGREGPFHVEAGNLDSKRV